MTYNIIKQLPKKKHLIYPKNPDPSKLLYPIQVQNPWLEGPMIHRVGRFVSFCNVRVLGISDSDPVPSESCWTKILLNLIPPLRNDHVIFVEENWVWGMFIYYIIFKQMYSIHIIHVNIYIYIRSGVRLEVILTIVIWKSLVSFTYVFTIYQL